jgi:glycosyltransferase involved in cell wall biosynthesis
MGHIDGPIKASVLAAGDLFVLPSFSENFGVAAVEALAAGLPCILGRGVALAAEIESAGAGLVTDPAPDRIAEQLRIALGDDARRQSAAERALRWAETYSATNMGAKLLHLYRGILRTA